MENNMNSENIQKSQKKYSNQIWFRENTFALARQFKTRAEFRNANYGAYNAAVRNGWINEMTFFQKLGIYDKNRKDTVYAYFFVIDGINYTYIGRTVNPRARDRAHRTSETDTVKKFADSMGVEVPKVTTLLENITVAEGLVKENYYVNKYREEGHILLNKAKTGLKSGSCGCLGFEQITYDYCKSCALKCETIGEFRDQYDGGCYSKSSALHWIDDFTWLKRKRDIRREHSLEECENIARQYNDTMSFAHENKNIYVYCIRKDWIKRFTWLKTAEQLREERRNKILENSKKFKTFDEFREVYPEDFNYSRDAFLLNEMTWLEWQSNITRKENNMKKQIEKQQREIEKQLQKEQREKEAPLRHEMEKKRRNEKYRIKMEEKRLKEDEEYEKQLHDTSDGIIWKDIPGYEGLYQAGSNGMIRSIYNWQYDKKRINVLNPNPSKKSGIKSVSVCVNGVQKHKYVHYLVAITFVDRVEGCDELEFIDGDRSNTRPENLRWITADKKLDNQARILGKPILQFDMDHNLIAEYRSIKDAARHIGVDSACISNVVNGRGKSCKGFLWEFKK